MLKNTERLHIPVTGKYPIPARDREPNQAVTLKGVHGSASVDADTDADADADADADELGHQDLLNNASGKRSATAFCPQHGSSIDGVCRGQRIEKVLFQISTP
jgi:hypothetical protein